MTRPEPRAREFIVDGALLVALVAVSAWPYLAGLGFYSDDWAFIGDLATARDRSLVGYVRVLWDQDPARPLFAPLVAVQYWLFGASPLGYHVVNHALLAAASVFLYLSLRRLGLPRVLAVAWPAVFSLLPHYATDRLWLSVVHVNLSVSACALSLWAALRRASSPHPAVWRGLSLAAAALSVLSYEVITPLLLLVPLLEYAAPGDAGTRRRDGRSTLLSGLGIAAVIAAAAAYKMSVSPRVEVPAGSYGEYVRWLVSSAFHTSLVDLGWQLPAKVATVLREHGGRASPLTALALGAIVAAAVHRAARSTPVAAIGRGAWAALAGGGLMLVAAGYTTFLVTSHVGFHATGMNNRTAIAAALGVAAFALGAWGGIVSVLPPRARHAPFVIGVAIVAASASLVTMLTASYWVDASAEQQRLIARLRQDVATLPAGSRLLLDGVCPYRGPGTVFETDWDATGMLRWAYGDPSLTGDVLGPSPSIDGDAVLTGIYEAVTRNPFGDRLFVYDVDRRTLTPLPDRTAAERYFAAARRVTRPACVRGQEGSGAPVF
ncbi:MAG: hypothetical protein AB7O28_11145 [Vicinamibacterales bacterium]